MLAKHRPSHGLRKVLIAAVVVLLFARFHSHTAVQSTLSAITGGALDLRRSNFARNGKDRLVVVLPFTAGDIEHELGNLETWAALGSPTLPRDAHKVDLIFLYNRVEDDNVSSFLSHSRFERAWSTLRRSFGTYRVMYCDLNDVEDIYPAGPSNMFFKLFLKNDLREAIAPYMAVYWMEWDVFPIRPYWASQLLKEADTDEPFWQRGSIYLGRAFDSSVLYSYNWNWVSHINGNALYTSDDPDWREFLELVRDQEPPNHYWKPFDVSIAKVFHHLPYSWAWQQRFSGRFQYSDYVLHYGFTIQDTQIEEALQNPDTFLIHGKRTSAGKVKYDSKMSDSSAIKDVQWGDEVTADLRLSVLIRSWREDLEFAVLAAMSVKTHVWNALEIVVVMPAEDLALFKTKKWPDGVKLVAEPKLLPNGDIQQKLTKLRSDLYCEGDYILHLDSDTVIARTLIQKDVVWRAGRPALSYAPYDTLPEVHRVWREGTSAAMGREVEYEFSRNSFHVYPRAIYAKARAFLERQHSMSLVDFLSTRLGKNTGVGMSEADRKRLFSDFNFLGAYAYYEEPDLLTWVPAWDEGRNKGLFPIIPAIICQGNARLAMTEAEIRGSQVVVQHMKKLLVSAMTSGSCAEIDAMVVQLEDRTWKQP